MVARDFSLIVFSLLSASVFASHFRGGLIQWKPVDSNTVRIYVLFSSIDVNLFAMPQYRKCDQVRVAMRILIQQSFHSFLKDDFFIVLWQSHLLELKKKVN